MTSAHLDNVLALLATLEAAPTFDAFNAVARGVDELMDLAPGDPELNELQIMLNAFVWHRTTGQPDAAEQAVLEIKVMVACLRALTPDSASAH